MKRKTFNILVDGKHVATKHAWNTARKEVANVVRAALNQSEKKAEKQFSSYQKNDDGYYLCGVESWQTDKNRLIKVEIIKQVQ